MKKLVTTVTDSNGYRMKLTFRVGKWIKGSDTSALEAAWESVGGDGGVPLVSTVSSEGWGTYNAVGNAIVFGTVEVQNLSTEYPVSGFGNGNHAIKFEPNAHLYDRNADYGTVIAKIGPMAIATGVSSGLIESGFPRFSAENKFTLVNPSMNTDTWGPVPFAVGIDRVFSPKYPKGNPMLKKVEFTVGVGLINPMDGWKVSRNTVVPGVTW